ncbi:hypothetical protein [Sinorhizobium sp. GL28]|uniref:hypothetical protein n=1 Tax=Sinorhizobium sp. GL28 TaxID=1358418 RepID=UPI00071DCFFE|nr:hypothetical protein [Sinorhizobium sp. GL28]KSV88939.1 hypothetical protein N184_08490 [Sinorhizobium sp. GL28]
MTMLVDEQRLMCEVGTELVVGSAPPEKAGSASAMTETVQDLGISLGIAVLGAAAHAAVSDRLWGALAVRAELPAGLIEDARAAFTTGFNSAAILSAIAVTILAVLAAVGLRYPETRVVIRASGIARPFAHRRQSDRLATKRGRTAARPTAAPTSHSATLD